MIMSNGKEARLNSRYFGGSRAGERMRGGREKERSGESLDFWFDP